MTSGKQYENDLQNELHRSTEDNFVVRCGYSGNSALPMPDIYCRNSDGTYDVAFEVKRSSRDHIYVDRDDFVNLFKLESRTPWLLDCVFAYKFSNREMFIHSLPIKSKDTVSDVMDRYVSEYRSDAHIGGVRRSSEERIRVDKPDLENGVSATQGRSDADVLKSCLP